MKTVLSIFVLVFLLACTNSDKKQPSEKNKSNNKLVSDDYQIAEDDIESCLPSDMDTINKSFEVSFINKGKYFCCEIKIKNIKKLLDYKFNCRIPEVNIPRFRSYYRNWLCLERGCSDHCVIYYLYKLEADSIFQFSSFDEAYDIDLINSRCACLNQDIPNEILIIDYIRNRSFKKKLRRGKWYRDILELKISKNQIRILYTDNSRQMIRFSRKEFVDSIPNFALNANPPFSINVK